MSCAFVKESGESIDLSKQATVILNVIGA